MSVSYDRWVPGGHGTTDTVIIADGECYVIDFKYGRHVVEALEQSAAQTVCARCV